MAEGKEGVFGQGVADRRNCTRDLEIEGSGSGVGKEANEAIGIAVIAFEPAGGKRWPWGRWRCCW